MQSKFVASPVKLHKTRANPALIEEYFDAQGNLKEPELKIMVQLVRALRFPNLSLHTTLVKLSKQDSAVFPSPSVLMKWINVTNWSEVEHYYNFPPEQKKMIHQPKYSKEYLERWMDLIVEMYKRRGLNDFTIDDYRYMTLDDLHNFEPHKIISIFGKVNYDQLLRNREIPSLRTILLHLKLTFNEIKELRGCKIVRENKRWNTTREGLLALLIEDIKSTGVMPRYKYIVNNKKLPATDTFFQAFKVTSWAKIQTLLLKELERLELTHLIDY